MNKNYYDILQVNKNASSEIIEKAYKILAKKYHPDLQPEDQKKQAEEILKEINEAYEVLSNPEKKKDYDDFLLEEETQKHSEPNSYYDRENTGTNSNSIPIHELKYKQQQELLRQQKLQQEQQLQREKELAYQEQLQQAREKAYYDAYIQDLKNRGYKIRYKKSLKDYIKDATALILTILILFLLWQIPFIQNFLLQLFEENEILRALFKM